MADTHHVQDEEEEEEEPKLKYERVGRGVEELLQRDTVSCLVAHEKFIVRSFRQFHWPVSCSTPFSLLKSE